MWHTYGIPPIDTFWNQLKTVEDTAADLAAANARETLALSSGTTPSAEQFLEDWRAAQAEAKAAGWDGDFRRPPVVFWVPFDTDFQYGFVIKHDNNGDTFVISPVELPHLTENAFYPDK